MTKVDTVFCLIRHIFRRLNVYFIKLFVKVRVSAPIFLSLDRVLR